MSLKKCELPFWVLNSFFILLEKTVLKLSGGRRLRLKAKFNQEVWVNESHIFLANISNV
jgi:hypothetical protein